MAISRTRRVLIETYWNVKKKQLYAPRGQLKVLIETYWNVKIRLRPDPPDPRSGINRNILECKGRIRSSGSEVYEVLIETYWNVKISGFCWVVRRIEY
mgnify:FL=1